jgi:hypothetical protein
VGVQGGFLCFSDILMVHLVLHFASSFVFKVDGARKKEGERGGTAGSDRSFWCADLDSVAFLEVGLPLLLLLLTVSACEKMWRRHLLFGFAFLFMKCRYVFPTLSAFLFMSCWTFSCGGSYFDMN